MTLLVTVFSAVTATVIWYRNAGGNDMKIGTLCLMYWGASIMWLVDAIVGYSRDGADFFAPSGADMLNDLYLGLSVVALGLVIWLVILLIKDPRGVVRSSLIKK